MGALSVEERVKLLQALLPGIVLPSGAASAIGPAIGTWLAANGGDTAIPLATPSANGALSKFVRNSTIDFVLDCGADPTGATDCTAALNTAGAKLASLASNVGAGTVNGEPLPLQSTRLFVPRGKYLVTGSPNAWVFTGGPQSIEVVGVPDESIFLLGGNTGYGVFQPSQCLSFSLLGISAKGTFDTFNGDMGSLLYSSADNTIVDRLHVDWVACPLPIVYWTAGSLVMTNSSFIRSCCTDSTKGLVYSDGQNGLDMFMCRFLDSGRAMGGFGAPDAKVGRAPWLRISDSVASGAGHRAIVRVAGCDFDEQATPSAVSIEGNAARIARVELTGNKVNTSIGAGVAATASVHVKKVDLLIIDGHVDTGFNTAKDIPAIDLVDVGTTKISGLEVNPAATSRYITADSACKYLEIENAGSAGDVADVDVRSSATRTVIKAGGIASDLVAANGTIAANALAKMGASGAVVLGTADGSALMMGPTRQAAAAAGKAALARPGQVVPLLNDNNAAITAGDQVIVSASVAGRIRTGTTAGKGVGIAVVGSAQASDAITYVRVQPF